MNHLLKTYLFTLLVTFALQGQALANRACTEEDYAPVNVEVYECNLGPQSFTLYKNNELGIKTGRNAFAKNLEITKQYLECPTSSFDQRVVTEDGFTIFINQNSFPKILIQKSICVESSESGIDYDRIYSYTVQETYESIDCQFIANSKVNTKYPTLEICGFEDVDY